MTPDQLTDQKIAATLGKAIDLIIEYAEATMTAVYAEGEIRAQMWRNIAAIAAAKAGNQSAPGPWRIRVGQSYVRQDSSGWSLWADKRMATTWMQADLADAVMQRAPRMIRFEGSVERDG